ncbi:hypothetical protein J6590_014718 [Homalodisca vitripennis]|nr:hypothetical protein J6590_014718 [Homalodisca vitripennis]
MFDPEVYLKGILLHVLGRTDVAMKLRGLPALVLLVSPQRVIVHVSFATRASKCCVFTARVLAYLCHSSRHTRCVQCVQEVVQACRAVCKITSQSEHTFKSPVIILTVK